MTWREQIELNVLRKKEKRERGREREERRRKEKVEQTPAWTILFSMVWSLVVLTLVGRRNGFIKLKTAGSCHHGDLLGKRLVLALIWSTWIPVSSLWFMRNISQESRHVRIRWRGREDVRSNYCESLLKALDFCSTKKTDILDRHWQVRSPRQKMRSFFPKTPFSPSQTTF